MDFVGQKILGFKIPAHGHYSDDDVLGHSHSDSDILETVEKADFVEFSDDYSSTSSGSEGVFNTYVTFK